MQSKSIHIVSFNVPYPADYGGVIDVFYRIVALSKAGVKIHLHCFQYGRERSDVLDTFCEEVIYYPRSLSLIYQFSKLPFIVKTRSNKLLLSNLVKDEYPILFEGLHSCFFLNNPGLENRIKIVRSHNIEHEYYKGLAIKTSGWEEKIFFKTEAMKLKWFEKNLKHAGYIAAISETDVQYFQQHYGTTFLMPPNHPSDEVCIKAGRGEYILYHGDLSVPENIEAAMYILKEIVPDIAGKFVFAGRNPASELISAASKTDHVEIVTNPSHFEMQELIANAHINLLPTFQATGFKLKLLNALFNGRFCVGSPELVSGTGLDEACSIAKTNADYRSAIKRLMDQDFTDEMISKRKVLLKIFTNSKIIADLLALI